ncbi:MAG: hypothetical protein PHY14_00585 [Candidatus Gracilibacteria bacterium]|nr:hypothetical protein [Candidatus Gracilibacteria bacterium]
MGPFDMGPFEALGRAVAGYPFPRQQHQCPRISTGNGAPVPEVVQTLLEDTIHPANALSSRQLHKVAEDILRLHGIN